MALFPLLYLGGSLWMPGSWTCGGHTTRWLSRSLPCASPLRVLLYAFWSRRSRLASARGGAHIDILHSVVEPPILCVRSLKGLHPKAPHPISVPKSVTPRGAQVAPVTPPAPPPSLRH